LDLAELLEQGAQTSDLRHRLVGPLALRLGVLAFRLSPLPFRLGVLAFRLGFRRDQAAVGTEEPEPVALSFLHGSRRDAVPDAQEHFELLAPEPSVLVGLDGLIEPARQAKSLQLPRLRLVKEVLRRAAAPRVE